MLTHRRFSQSLTSSRLNPSESCTVRKYLPVIDGLKKLETNFRQEVEEWNCVQVPRTPSLDRVQEEGPLNEPKSCRDENMPFS